MPRVRVPPRPALAGARRAAPARGLDARLEPRLRRVQRRQRRVLHALRRHPRRDRRRRARRRGRRRARRRAAGGPARRTAIGAREAVVVGGVVDAALVLALLLVHDVDGVPRRRWASSAASARSRTSAGRRSSPGLVAPDERVRLSAYLRSVLNLGITGGALAGRRRRGDRHPAGLRRADRLERRRAARDCRHRAAHAAGAAGPRARARRPALAPRPAVPRARRASAASSAPTRPSCPSRCRCGSSRTRARRASSPAGCSG